MPELPQVQTVRKFLSQVLLKPSPKKIMTIKLYYPGIVKQIEPKQYIQTLLGQTFKQIDRYGKYIILKLNKNSIISHLRMQGKYSFYQKKPQIGKHDHVQFIMTDGSSLIYSDVRKFGTMYLTKKGQQFQHPSIRKLGPQINNSSTFTQQYLSEKCKITSGNIKNMLLDQQIICGAGNIYADEILFACKIHPEKNIQKLNSVEIKSIVKFGKSIIDQAIFNKGTTFRSFSSNHQKGNNQDFLKVYGKDNQNCEVCGFKIQKIKLGGRGTHFCSNCQKK